MAITKLNGEQVGFQQTGAGAVVRPAQDKLREFVSVKDFGAVGDGVTDDTSAIQAALDASTSRMLFFPAGNYLMGSTVSGNGSQIIWLDAGVTTNRTIVGVRQISMPNGFGPMLRLRQSILNPTTVSANIINIVSGRGDAATAIGVSGGYFQARDEPDVNASNRGFLYGLQLSLVPRVQRDLVGIDDVVGLVIQNDADVAGARATDAIYIGTNGNGAFGPEDKEWVTGVTVRANCGYPYRITGAYYTGFDASGKMSGELGNSFGFLARGEIQPGVTSDAFLFRSEAKTAASSFNLTNLRHYHATQVQIGAGSSVTNQYGFFAQNSLTGAANNYGFFGNLSSGSGMWNFYASGDAANYFSGQTLISPSPIDISSSNSVSARFQITGTSAAGSAVNLGRFSNDANGATLFFTKSRSGTIGGNGATSNNDSVVTIAAEANDGFKPVRAASIGFNVDGTPATGSMPGRITFSTTPVGSSSAAERLRITNAGVVRPGADNTQSFGEASFRWATLFAGTGTINTSDGREKQQVRDLSDAERAVAVRIKGLVRAFKFNDAVVRKGDDARTHVGVIAQEVIGAFEAEGLSAWDYALLCYDEWNEQPEVLDDDGAVISESVSAGSRYGVRYEELLAFIIASL